MNPDIFREYDIRGVIGKDFNVQDVETLGRGFGSYFQKSGGRKAVVGRDCRLSSPEISRVLIQAMAGTGLEVIDVGVCPTPVLYFALRHLNADGGVMITASHNPPEYNGFKVCIGYDTIFGEQIQEFRRFVEQGDFIEGQGSREEYDIITPYSDYLVENLSIDRPVKVAVDAGNGTGGVIAGPILKRLGCQVTELFFDMDGTFPNHPADPTIPKNMAVLSETVVREGLELGIGFDGDTDRIGVVDETGEIVYGDMLTLIFARDILNTNPGAKFVADVKCSKNLFDDVRSRGGEILMWKTGHSLIKNKLREENAVLAGEMSGHIFFNHRYFGYDDAIYGAGRILEIVARKKEPFSKYLSDLPPTYNTPEIRLDFPEDKKFRLVELVREELRKDHDIIDVDGVRVVFPDGWGLLRASNTGPITVLRFEAETPERLKEIQTLVEDVIERMKGRL